MSSTKQNGKSTHMIELAGDYSSAEALSKLREFCKVTLTERALKQRINRELPEMLKLRTARGVQNQVQVGEYYLKNIRTNFIVEKDVDLETLGRKLGVLKDTEGLAD